MSEGSTAMARPVSLRSEPADSTHLNAPLPVSRAATNTSVSPFEARGPRLPKSASAANDPVRNSVLPSALSATPTPSSSSTPPARLAQRKTASLLSLATKMSLPPLAVRVCLPKSAVLEKTPVR